GMAKPLPYQFPYATVKRLAQATSWVYIESMAYSRRQFHRFALSAASMATVSGLRAAKVESTIRGVRMGLITGSLNPLPETPPAKDIIDTVIEGCVAVGAANIELVNLLEPRLVGAVSFGHPPTPMTPEYEKSRAAVREWRLKTPIS